MSDNWKVFWVFVITFILIGGLGGLAYKANNMLKSDDFHNQLEQQVYDRQNNQVDNSIIDNTELDEKIRGEENKVKNDLNMNVTVQNNIKKK